MKIVVFDNLPEGGAKRVVFEQVKYLVGKGHQVSYFGGDSPALFDFGGLGCLVRQYKLQETNFKIQTKNSEQSNKSQVSNDKQISNQKNKKYKIGWIGWFWWRLWELPRLYRTIAAEIEAFEPEVVLVHHCRYTQAPWLLRYIKVPSVYYIEEPLRIVYEPELHPILSPTPFHSLLERVKRLVLKHIDSSLVKCATVLVANSYFTAESVAAAYGRDSLVVHPGVDNTKFKGDSRKVLVKKREVEDRDSENVTNITNRANVTNESEEYFLFVGERHFLNGWDLVEALQKRRPEIRVVVVDFKQGQFRMRDEELAELYRGATATLCLARREPFGLAAIESMACGTPVIAVAEGGYEETVVEAVTGYLIKRETGELIQRIDELSNWELRTQLGRTGRKRVIERFSWKRHGREMERVLLEV